MNARVSHDPFYNYPALYDLAYRWNTDRECKVIEQCFRRDAQRPIHAVLDLACGTGRHLVRLAQRGYRLIGVDPTETMLAFARERSAALGVQAAWCRQSLDELDLSEPVDAALCLMDSIRCLPTDAMWQRHLSALHRIVQPGGLYLIDCWVASAGDPKQAISERWEQQENGLRVEVVYHQFSETLDPAALTIDDQLTFVVHEQRKIPTVIPGRRSGARFLVESDVVAQAEAAGWIVVDCLTNWERGAPPPRYPARRLFILLNKNPVLLPEAKVRGELP